VATGDFDAWMAALEERHMADLRTRELTRALRAVSSAYVERRAARRAVLDTAGKRAAFALYYAPLHYLAVRHVVEALGAADPPPARILDVGCGTGAASAAWACAAAGGPAVTGFDRHPWAAAEARWTWRTLGLQGRARVAQAERHALRAGAGWGVVAAWVLNEMDEQPRAALEDALLDAAGRGARVLIVEPIARRLTPWWAATAGRVRALGGREDDWKFPVELPGMLRLLDTAAGLDHRRLTCRSLYLPGA
jgi:protein-L-isoaspartate O-methyltransferase